MSIQALHEGDRHTLLLTGELDMASAPQLEEQAQRVCEQDARELVLDMTRLEFIDSAGLNAVLKVRALCQEHMCDFGLTPGKRPVQRLFEVTRLIDRLPFRKSRHGEQEAPEGADTSPRTSGAEP